MRQGPKYIYLFILRWIFFARRLPCENQGSDPWPRKFGQQIVVRKSKISVSIRSNSVRGAQKHNFHHSTWTEGPGTHPCKSDFQRKSGVGPLARKFRSKLFGIFFNKKCRHSIQLCERSSQTPLSPLHEG